MAQIRTNPLMTISLSFSVQTVGVTPNGNRRIGVVSGGTFEGSRLWGTILPGGTDWAIVRPDDVALLDVRLVLQTDDSALIGITYRGIRHGPAEVIERLTRDETVDPAEYYFRTVATFETASPRYGWLNRIFALGLGDRSAGKIVYELFELL
jgi:hypothetical protein